MKIIITITLPSGKIAEGFPMSINPIDRSLIQLMVNNSEQNSVETRIEDMWEPLKQLQLHKGDKITIEVIE